MHQSNATRRVRVLNQTAAGTGDTLNSSIVDLQNAEGVRFVAALGAVTAGATVQVQIQGNTVNSASGMTTLGGTAATVVTGADNKLITLDVYRPSRRFVRLQIVRNVANVAIDSVVADVSGTRNKPTTPDATEFSLTKLVSP